MKALVGALNQEKALGLLRDYEPSDGPSFQALPDIHRHLETGGHQLPASAAGINNSNLNIDILPR